MIADSFQNLLLETVCNLDYIWEVRESSLDIEAQDSQSNNS